MGLEGAACGLLCLYFFLLLWSILLDMHGVIFALSTPKPDSAIDAGQLQQWVQANKVCHHTLLNALSNDLFDI